MKLKVPVLVLVTFTLALPSIAQISFGLRAGVNLQNIAIKYPDGEKIDTDLKTGFHVGVNAEMHIAGNFYLQPGILFSTKGTKADHDLFTYRELKVSLSYIEVPVNLLYKPVLGPGKLLLGIGPYAAYAIGGSVKRFNKDGHVEFKNKIPVMGYYDAPFDAIYYARRLDAGANLLLGYEFAKKISVQLNAQLGMIYINPAAKDEPKDKSQSKNWGFGISIGYRLK